MSADVRQEPWFDAQAYPFRSRFLRLPGGRMHYLDEGSGPPVVLVHGTPGWSWEYRAVVSALSARFRCIAPDHLGFGLSDKPADWAYTLEAHTANLRALLQHLALERFSLVVHDFGGPLALPLALERPGRVERLAVINSWLWPLAEVDPSFERRRELLRSRLVRWLYLHANLSARVLLKMSWGRRARLGRRVHRHYTGVLRDAASRHGTVGFLRATTDDDAYLAALSARAGALAGVPALLLWGAADPLVGPAHLERWRAVLPGAEVHLLEGVGHFPQEEAGAEVARRLRAFLERTQPPRDAGGPTLPA